MSNLREKEAQETRGALNEIVRMQGDLLTAEGNSVEQKRAGFEQYKLAAENGDVQSMFEIACCFNYGTGTKQDIAYATVWLNKAAAAGHTDATEALERYKQNTKASEINTLFYPGFFVDAYEGGYHRRVIVDGELLNEMGFSHFEPNKAYTIYGLSDGMHVVGILVNYYPPDEDGYGEGREYMYGYYDKNLYPIIPFKFSKASPFNHGIAEVSDKTGTYCVNKKGERQESIK